MFGLGKLIGGALNAIGLGSIAPFVSLAMNAMSGNFVGIATDIMGLMSNIKGLDFLNKVAQFAPLGAFGSSGATGGCFGNFLSSGRLGDLTSKLTNFASLFTTPTANTMKIMDMFKIAQEVLDNRMLVESGRRTADMNRMLA